jgi:NADP-reducing hydrogenase subunit HndB
MSNITSLDELHQLKIDLVLKRNEDARRGVAYVTVGMGTCGIAVGAKDVFQTLKDGIKAHGLKDVTLVQTGCIGLCGDEPIVEVTVGKKPKVSYGRVTPAAATRIIEEHLMQAKVLEDLLINTAPFPRI